MLLLTSRRPWDLNLNPFRSQGDACSFLAALLAGRFGCALGGDERNIKEHSANPFGGWD